MNLDCLHKRSLQWRGGNLIPRPPQNPFSVSPGDDVLKIVVKTLTGKKITVKLKRSSTIKEVKSRIQVNENTPSDKQRLLFSGVQLEDGITLASYNIQEGSTLYLICGVDALLTLDAKNIRSNRRPFGWMFELLEGAYWEYFGWNMVAVSLKNKYRPTARLGGTLEGEWGVSYHGTKKTFAEYLALGRGIYSTPHLEMAARHAEILQYRGKQYKVILQNSVNMADIGDMKEKNYYVTRNEKNIRLCGMLYKEILFNIEEEDLNPEYDFDYTNLKDDGKIHRSGGREYKRPYGWIRLALNLSQKYESEAWLWEGSVDSWTISYHGTNRQSVEEIVRTHYDLSKGKRFHYGRGIYSTPDPSVAEKYSKAFQYQGNWYKVILQNRVNMEDTEYIAKKDYFLTKNPNKIIPYGILYKKVQV